MTRAWCGPDYYVMVDCGIFMMWCYLHLKIVMTWHDDVSLLSSYSRILPSCVLLIHVHCNQITIVNVTGGVPQLITSSSPLIDMLMLYPVRRLFVEGPAVSDLDVAVVWGWTPFLSVLGGQPTVAMLSPICSLVSTIFECSIPLRGALNSCPLMSLQMSYLHWDSIPVYGRPWPLWSHSGLLHNLQPPRVIAVRVSVFCGCCSLLNSAYPHSTT